MTKQDRICLICGEGHLEVRVDKNLVEYKGRSTELDAHYSVCDSCGSEQADAEQARQNKRAMLAFKKKVDGLLTGKEIRALRNRLGINQSQAAAIFGGGPVAFSKYESDDVAQSEAMDKLLRLVEEVPAAFKYLVQRAGIQIPRQPVYVPTDLRMETDKPTARKPYLKLIYSSPLSQQPAKYANAA